jgi:hypothetical protein
MSVVEILPSHGFVTSASATTSQPAFGNAEAVHVLQDLLVRLLWRLCVKGGGLHLHGVLLVAEYDAEVEPSASDRHLADDLPAAVDDALEKRL